MTMQKLLTVILLTCAISLAAYGQEPDSKITGTVKDPGGAVVSGADVSLLTSTRAVLRDTVTDASGNFTLDKIRPGDYQLNVEASGFVRYRSAVRVRQSSPVEVAVVMELTPLNEQVTITAEAGLVSDTRKVPTQINIIDEREILERAPEVVAQVVDEEPGVNLQRTSPSLSAVFVRGLTGRNVAVYVDGVRYTTSAQRGGVGTFFSLIEPSALESVEILRGPNSSQYGSDVLGGVVNFISHAPAYGGDDGWHGRANVFYTSASNGFGGN